VGCRSPRAIKIISGAIAAAWDQDARLGRLAEGNISPFYTYPTARSALTGQFSVSGWTASTSIKVRPSQAIQPRLNPHGSIQQTHLSPYAHSSNSFSVANPCDLMFTFAECARRRPTQPEGVSQGQTPPRPGQIPKIIRVVRRDHAIARSPFVGMCMAKTASKAITSSVDSEQDGTEEPLVAVA
jgi:hypothetical protein